MRCNSILLIIALLCVAGASHAQNDTLIARVHTSLGIQNPSAPTRVVEITNDTTAILQNPFNYQFGFGLTGSYSDFSFGMDYQYARENGLNFVVVEYTGRYRKDAYEIGGRYYENERNGGLYTLRFYVEGKLFDWIGVGITREYAEPWMEDPGTLARFSLARNNFTILKLLITVRAEYEINPDRSRQFLYMDIQNFKYSRFALIPTYRIERIKRSNTILRSYQGLVQLTVALD